MTSTRPINYFLKKEGRDVIQTSKIETNNSTKRQNFVLEEKCILMYIKIRISYERKKCPLCNTVLRTYDFKICLVDNICPCNCSSYKLYPLNSTIPFPKSKRL